MRTITVSGRGVGRATPDTAVVHAAAVHHAAALPDALAGAESARASMVEVARRFTDQVASQSLSVTAEWTEMARQRFRARHALVLRCPDLEQAGALVAALAAEVDDRLEVDHVGLEVDDPRDAETAARAAALEDARAKAEHLAGLAGGTLGPVVSITEGSGHGPGPMAESLARSFAKVGFEAGETMVEQTLTVTWELA